MKAIKIIAGLVIAIIVIIGILLAVTLSNLNRIVEEVIETTGSSSLQTAVNVSGVDIKLTEGHGTINGLTIANPKGYSDANVLAIGSVGLQLDLESVAEEVKVIKDVFVDGVKLRAEQKNIKDTNIQTLIDNIQTGSGKANTNSSDSTATGEDARLMIETLRFGESEITLETENYGSRVFTLPAYSQSNIGNKSQGLTPAEVGQVIMNSLLAKVKAAVKDELENIAKDKAKEKLDKEKDRLKDKLKDKVGDNVSEGDIDKIKGLFK